MSETMVLAISAVAIVGVAAVLIGALVRSIVRADAEARRQGTLRAFGLSLAFCVLFLVSWGAQAVAEWGVYRQEQQAHGERPVVGDYLVQFSQSTLENWQSEFLQLFSFVVFSALLIHQGSAESRDSDDRMEASLDRIERRLADLETRSSGAADRPSV
jgi:cytochrome c biogenesis factor